MEQMYLYDMTTGDIQKANLRTERERLYDIRKTDEIREAKLRRVTPLLAEDENGTTYLPTHYVWAKDLAVMEAVREAKKNYADLWSWDEEANGIRVQFARNDDTLEEKRFCYGELNLTLDEAELSELETAREARKEQIDR